MKACVIYSRTREKRESEEKSVKNVLRFGKIYIAVILFNHVISVQILCREILHLFPLKTHHLFLFFACVYFFFKRGSLLLFSLIAERKISRLEKKKSILFRINFRKAREIPHSRTLLHPLINTMFAATQQIASVAGLRATKVQVRTDCFSLLPFAFDRRCAEYDALKRHRSSRLLLKKAIFSIVCLRDTFVPSLARSGFCSHN